MSDNLIDWLKSLTIPAGGITASFALANQILGTIAAIMSIGFIVWKWKMDDLKYKADKAQMEEMNRHVDEMMVKERKGYKKEQDEYERNK